MRPGYFSYFCIAVCFLTIGYVLGTSDIAAPQVVQAQDEEKEEDASPLSEGTRERVKAAIATLDVAKEALEGDGHYTSVTIGINSFAVTCGGVDAVTDLERGTGVDPETFAALYAGQETNEIVEHIGRDNKGRLTYKNKVVRMYPVSRLKKMLEQRDKLSGKEDVVE